MEKHILCPSINAHVYFGSAIIYWKVISLDTAWGGGGEGTCKVDSTE
jgi:hypothetical protein